MLDACEYRMAILVPCESLPDRAIALNGMCLLLHVTQFFLRPNWVIEVAEQLNQWSSSPATEDFHNKTETIPGSSNNQFDVWVQ